MRFLVSVLLASNLLYRVPVCGSAKEVEARRAKKKVEALSLRFKLIFDYKEGSETRQQLVIRSSSLWRCRTSAGVETESVCDGKVVWSYYLTDDKKGKEYISKYDLSAVPLEAKETALSLAYCYSTHGLFWIYDPNRSHGGDAMDRAAGVEKTVKMGEERIDGQPTILYKRTMKDGHYFLTWYGKKDGIIRQEIFFLRGKPFATCVVTAIEKKAVPISWFRFSPPKGVRITDKTNELMKEVKRLIKKHSPK